MDQRKLIFISLFLSFLTSFGQNPGDSFVQIGKRFLGVPYRANMLSTANPEQLIASLDAFDCVTFLENSLAIQYSKGVDSNYLNALRHVRYSGDTIQYEKRFHYFSDAMHALGFSLISDPLHTRVLKKDYSFLSSYLKSKQRSTINIELLQNREKVLAKRTFQYTDVADLPYLLPLIKSGDIVAFVSPNPHLDFLHTGMLVKQGNSIHLLHASQEKMQVVLSDQSLQDYLKSHRKFIGICVFRPIFNE